MADSARNRSSEGVHASVFPRTDFPQQGWIRKPTGTLFDTPAVQNWQIQTVQTPRGVRWSERRLSYTDFPQQGWIRKPTGTLFDRPDQQDWNVDTVQTSRGIRWAERRLLYTDFPQPAWMGVKNITAGAGTLDSQRVRQSTERFPDTNQDVSWIAATTGFDPSTLSWLIPSTDRGMVDHSLFYGGEKRPVAGSTPQPPAAPAFDPTQTSWTIDSGLPQRRQKPTYWLDATRGIQNFGLLDSRLTEPAYEQLWWSFLPKTSRRWIPVTNPDPGWITANTPIPFDPTLFPRSTDVRTRERYKKVPRLDQTQDGWISANTPPAVLPQLVTHSSDDRMRPKLSAAPHFQEVYYSYFSDLSWVHDVIPLVDPIPTVSIHHRRIAPVMNARRNKRR